MVSKSGGFFVRRKEKKNVELELELMLEVLVEMKVFFFGVIVL